MSLSSARLRRPPAAGAGREVAHSPSRLPAHAWTLGVSGALRRIRASATRATVTDSRRSRLAEGAVKTTRPRRIDTKSIFCPWYCLRCPACASCGRGARRSCWQILCNTTWLLDVKRVSPASRRGVAHRDHRREAAATPLARTLGSADRGGRRIWPRVYPAWARASVAVSTTVV